MSAPNGLPIWNAELPIETRIDDLIGRMTLEEKVGQLLHEAPAIERLGIPAYNWWNECLHGVARNGVATVFPQAIGLAAMWDDRRLFAIGEIIALEGRAKYHEALRHNDRGYYRGLTYWTPNINIFRDPRWGRGHETYGECPYLTGRLGVAFVKGLQGSDPKYLKAAACAKHYAVHSGPEGLRHEFDARCSLKDLYETYLPAFRDLVMEAKVESVMGAYNRTNGEPCCGSPTLLDKILRGQFGFEGHVVSDCWAIRDFHEHHKVTKTPAESAAMAITHGCDLNCGCTFTHLVDAVRQGLVEEKVLDRSLKRLFKTRIKLGMFDPDQRVPLTETPYEMIGRPEHRQAALDAARASIVLLKNANNMLPLRKDLGSIAVIGPNAYDPEVLKANYFGTSAHTVTPLEGIRNRVSPQTRVWYTPGCNLTTMQRDGIGAGAHISEAVSMAQRADAVIMCVGLSAQIEGEQGDTSNKEASGDKIHLDLTGLQQELLEAVHRTGKPIILVVISGSALALNWADQNCAAVLQAWYGGEEAGNAIADVIFGATNPAGRLPVTFVKGLEQLPDFKDYNMIGRTYRYMKEEPLYPFGFGLSYSRFEYSDIKLSKPQIAVGEPVDVSATVINKGPFDGEEVVQLYIRDLDSSVRVPNHELRGFKRIHLKNGESQRVVFTVKPRDLSLIDEQGQRVLEPGKFECFIGGSQPDSRSLALTGRKPLSTILEVTGSSQLLPYS